MDAVLRIPCADGFAADLDTVAAMEQFFDICGILIKRFLFGKLSGNLHPVMVSVTADAENMVDFFLCKGKSEGCIKRYTLRFPDKLYLFFLRGEQGELFTTHGRIENA